MAFLQLTDSFQHSYENFESYPHELVYQSSYLSTTQAHKARLEDHADRLFTTKDEDINIPFRDLLPTGQGKCLPTFLPDWCAHLKSV